MDKGAIKNFAVEARKILIKSAVTEAGFYGVTKDGCSEPIQKGNDFEVYKTIAGTENRIYGNTIKKRANLVKAIKEHGFEQVMEETAYTWFNRLIAIRFMEVNDYLPTRLRVLSSEVAGKREPDIVTQFLDVELNMSHDELSNIQKAKEENRYDDAFRMLFIKQCNELNDILPGLFEKTDDYMELLLRLSYTNDGVVRMLVDGVPKVDFDVSKEGQVEIIGWMYQYYNTELNDLVYDGGMSKERISKELLPAATQLFTPDWTVKYMVDNSVGKLLCGLGYNQIKEKLVYLIDSEDNHVDEINIEEIKVIDPSMGSGHMLVYVFEVLMEAYKLCGYTERDAAILILKKNIFGIDIDKRAYQIAYFALMMKAREYNRKIFVENIFPNIIYSINTKFIDDSFSDIISGKSEKVKNEINYIKSCFDIIDEIGSIVKVDTKEFNDFRKAINDFLTLQQNDIISGLLQQRYKEKLEMLIMQLNIFTRKYDVVITNPPYLSNSRMSPVLSEYVNKHYSDVKSDFCMVFYKKALDDMCKDRGYISFITTSAWMTIKSFKDFRKTMLDSMEFETMVDFGTELFDGKVGHNPIVAWVNRKQKKSNNVNVIRLVEYCYSRRDEKQKEFFNNKNKITANQETFSKLPGMPIAYWANENVVNAFANGRGLNSFTTIFEGLKTRDKERFLRYWFEVISPKWKKYAKGGNFRKWYGNNDYVVNWGSDGTEVRNFKKSSGANFKYFFQPAVTYGALTSYKFSGRYIDDSIFGGGGGGITCADDIYYILGFVNSSAFTFLINFFSKTMNFEVGQIGIQPLIVDEDKRKIIDDLVKENIMITKENWDSFETSNDFKKHPIVEYHFKTNEQSIEKCILLWIDYLAIQAEKLKSNEEEVNRIFANIYGLESEVEISVNKKDINASCRQVNQKEAVESLISYAVGCMFGRYSIDNDGLVCVSTDFNPENYKTFGADCDNIIPITDEEYFNDDIVERFFQFVSCVFGEEKAQDNIDYIANIISSKPQTSKEKIRSYFLNDFYKMNYKMYLKTPIYWLFDSGKQNGFKALIYMHRYDRDTVGRVRADYLHKTQNAIEGALKNAEYIISSSTSAVDRAKATKDRDKYIKQLSETRIYDQALAHVALQRIEIDLDDGVKHNYQLFQGVEVSSEGSKKQSVDLLAKL